MKVGLTLQPGDRGTLLRGCRSVTRKLVAIYGDNLVCVRYRYDATRNKRLKTVETIVEEIPWTPRPGNEDPVFLKIQWNEKSLQTKIKNCQGRWNKNKKLWILPYGEAKKLDLLSRRVE
jgi:hypothetical protein